MKQYQPLYLKYRPQKLSEVIGQEVVTKTLTNAISYNKIVHAYLFCGPRGTGKTSCARILAKSLNCEKGITVNPCEECINCKSIVKGNSLDVIEIDAASHRKVEDAEDLINRVNLGTYGSRYKIYIIDEVHMLTDHAFNALLKTLEEPPNNVIFILATTEEHKVIPTIISRCQKLDFKPAIQQDLEKRIKYISNQEKINIDKPIIDFILKKSNGCIRDAVSLLDQISVLQIDDKPIDSSEIFKLFGTVDRHSLLLLLEAVLSFNEKDAVKLAEDLIKSGKDVSELLKEILELIIDLAKAKIDLTHKKSLSVELNNDLNILDRVQQNHLLKVIDRLHNAQTNIRFALSQELQFMVEIMSMMNKDFLISLFELRERIEKLENNGQLSTTSHKPSTISHLPSTESPLPPLPMANLASGRRSEATAKEQPAVSHKQDVKEIPAAKESSNIDVLWNKIVSLVESNSTKTLLTQSDSCLINLTDDFLEVGLSKDIFLPRLEKDIKRKDMLLKAASLASGLDPKTVRFRIVPKTGEQKRNTIEPNLDNKPQIMDSKSNINDDDFSKAIKDLLGAKEIS